MFMPKSILKVRLLALCVFVLGGACECGEDISSLPVPVAVLAHMDDETPPLEFLDVDLGAVQLNATNEAEFVLRNDGKARLQVSQIRLTSDPFLCPNSSGAFSFRNAGENLGAYLAERALDPNEQMTLQVGFTPTAGGVGCTVIEVNSTNDEKNPRLLARLTARGDAPQLCADNALIDFGEVDVGDEATRAIRLESCGTKAITITNWGQNDQFPPFDIDLPATPILLQPNEFIELSASFRPVDERTHTVAGGTAGLLTVNADGGVQDYQLALIGSSRRPPACQLLAVPNVINFGSVAAGRTSEQDVLLRNVGDESCTVSNVELQDPTGPFSWESDSFQPNQVLEPSELFTVRVRYAPQTSGASDYGVLKVSSDDPITPLLEINLEGNPIEPTPCMLEANPTGVNFGYQAVGRTAERVVMLTNVGTETCLVKETTMLSGGPDFGVIASLFPILGAPVPAGDSFSIIVTYRPRAATAQTGTLQISFKELGFGNPNQTLQIPLTGEGLSPCIRVTPSNVDFGNVAVGQSQTQDVNIENCGAVVADVRGVQLRAATHPDFSFVQPSMLPFSLMPGATLTLQVNASPTAAGIQNAGAAMYGYLDVLSDDVLAPSQPVSLLANAPQCVQGLVCAPTLLDFGEVNVGDTMVRALSCTNMGTSAVTISPQATSPFSIVHAPSSIAVGGTGVVTLRFVPTNTTIVTATLPMGATTCDGQPIVVQLTGEGIDDAFPTCPTPEAFEPQVVWHWEGGATLPNSKQVWVTPLVSRLEDTDGNGRLTKADMPRVIFISFDHQDAPDFAVTSQDAFNQANDPVPGVLRAVDGATGAEVFTVIEQAYRLNSSVTPVVADIDADGYVEIIAQKWVLLEGVEDAVGAKIQGKFRYGNLLAFEHDGTLKWQSDEWVRSEAEIEDAAGLSVGDVDGDGFAEIAVGDHLFDHNGHLLFQGGKGIGSTGHGPASVLANVDGQPGLELVAGNTVYRADGSILWNRSDLADGHPAVADLDGDGDVEVVLMNGRLLVLDGRTGSTIAGPLHPPTRLGMSGECNPGSGSEEDEDPCSVIPTQVALADINGDGSLEIGVARQEVLLIYDRNLSELWRTEIWDGTGASGPLAFDFDGDGSKNVVYSDEGAVWVYDTQGAVIYEAERGSVTMMETPAVADINNDGHANIVVGSNEPNFGLADGLDALTNTGTSWVHARAMWNQHGYMEDLIGELGAPIYEPTPTVEDGFRTATAQCRSP